MVQQGEGKSYHEWFIEFENEPYNLEAFAEKVDSNLREKNVYYDDLIAGNILQRLQIRPVQKSGFINYMKSIGKLGGQNKLPRLSNDRKVAEGMEAYVVWTGISGKFGIERVKLEQGWHGLHAQIKWISYIKYDTVKSLIYSLSIPLHPKLPTNPGLDKKARLYKKAGR